MYWSYIEQTGLGLMGFSPFVLYSMSLSEFQNAVVGFQEGREYDQRQEWERVRWATCVLLGPSLKKNASMTPSKLLPLPWDVQSNDSAPTKEMARESLERIKKRDRKKWQS